MEKTVNYILVDLNNDGFIYKVIMVGNVVDCMEFLSRTSNEVLLLKQKSLDKLKKQEVMKEKVLGDFSIVSCQYYCDRCQSLERSKLMKGTRLSDLC